MTDKFKQTSGNTNLIPAILDRPRWAFFNAWSVEAQANDRSPMPAVASRTPLNNTFTPSASAQRSTIRRKQQAMFKEWSQGRHE